MWINQVILYLEIIACSQIQGICIEQLFQKRMLEMRWNIDLNWTNI